MAMGRLLTAGGLWCGCVWATAVGPARPAFGQTAGPGAAAAVAAQGAQADVARQGRTLEQCRRDIQTQGARDVPVDQRALIDYGGYLTLSYLSFDDQVNDNH